MSPGPDPVERLRAARAPDEADAKHRSWGAVADAFDEREPGARPRRLVPAIAIGAAVVAASLAISPPGRAIAQWARRAVSSSASAPPRPVVLATPGRVIVVRSGALSMLRPDGSGRSLGPYSDASWSPHCRYVAATAGRTIVAVDPETAEVRWTLPRPGVVSDPRWAPSGFRVAYLANHRELRIVRGDGVDDRQLVARVADVAPAWRPGSGANVVAYVRSHGPIEIVDVDTGRSAGRFQFTHAVRSLHWTSDGRDIVVVDTAGVVIVNAQSGSRKRLHQLTAAPIAVSVSPAGRSIAVLTAATARPLLIPIDTPTRSRYLPEHSRLNDLRFSPDGSRILLVSSAGDSWELVSVRGVARAPKFEAVSARSVVGSVVDPAFPSVRGWCSDSRP